MAIPRQTVTQLLVEWSNGDAAALDKLMPLVHDELRRLARHYMRRQRPDHTLQATALINELYLRLVEVKEATWKDRAHFYALAARAMRHILIDQARQHRYAKRGGGARRVMLEEIGDLAQQQAADLMALDDALKALAEIDRRKSEVVELKFFGGLSIEEVATVLKVSPATVEREWRLAKGWLRQQIGG